MFVNIDINIIIIIGVTAIIIMGFLGKKGSYHGGDSSAVQHQLRNVQQIKAGSWVAVKELHGFRVWGLGLRI